jgi:cytochrome P450
MTMAVMDDADRTESDRTESDRTESDRTESDRTESGPGTDGWQFSHIDPALPPRMNEVFGGLRARCPLVRSDRHGGFWAMLSYAAVQQVASDPATFSSAHGISVPRFTAGVPHLPGEADPPEHTEYRRVIQRHFTRRAVAQYEPVIRDLTRRRLTALVAAGREIDIVAELAQHVPPVAIALILGLPPEDGEKFIAFTGAMFAGAASEDPAVDHALRDGRDH